VTDIAPTANNGSAATLAGVAVSGSLSATPAYSGQILTYSLAGSPTNGTVSITNASTGAYTYTPKSGFAGSDSFTFKATDQAGTASNTATVSVTVNDRPATANDGSVATTADTSVNGTILAATSYPGQTFTYSIVSSPAHGSLTLNNNMTGSFTYIPATGYVGADSFTFNATDAYGTVSNTATESVTVNDTAPTALAGTDSTSPDVAVSYTLAAGAYAGQTLTFSVAANPAHGSVTITNAGTGAFTYTPAQGFAGSDGFTFKVIDQYGSSSTATETIVVIDQAPVASGGNILTSPDLGVNGTLPAMAAYAGQTLTFSVSANPSHGTFNITNASTGAFTYTPATGYAGTDSFAYQVTDQWGASATATESVTVNDIAPTISGTTAFSMTHNTTHSGSFTSTPQYSGQVLTFGVVTNPAHGTLTLNATTGAYTYKPATGYKGSDSFSVNVTDQWGTASNTLTVTVSVK
ncbi:MAG: Ig-like domain-containing protein, partial [Bacillota bacterium]